MKTIIQKTIVLGLLILAAFALVAQDAASEPSQETVSVSNPLKPQAEAAAKAAVQAEPQAATSQAAAASAHKIEWKSEEAKRRMSGQAAEATHGDAPRSMAQKDGPPAWRLAVAFVVMAVLLYGLYLFLKRFGKKITGQESGSLKIVSKIRIDSRNTLALIQFHEEELVLAVNSAGGIQLLTKCAQIDLAESESNSGLVDENDASDMEPGAVFNSLGSLKGSSSGIKTVKDELI